jgi:hypothetical protein
LHKEGLPAAASWNTGGFTFQWHVDQVRSGHRLIPSFKMPSFDELQTNPAKVVLYKDGLAKTYAPEWAYLKANNLPLCLRADNLAVSLTSPRYRLPKVLESIPNSPLLWSMKDGVLEDEAVVDSFGDPKFWANEGTVSGNGPFVSTIQQLLPAPAWGWMVENHESAIENISKYIVQVKTPKGQPYWN